MAEGKDGDQEQRGKTEHDHTEAKDLRTVRRMCGDPLTVGGTCGISDDPVLRTLYRVGNTAAREGARYQGCKRQDYRFDGNSPGGQ